MIPDHSKLDLRDIVPVREFNFDGLIGPTHNYAGLSFGNVASAAHKNQISNPRAAALQGLAKMRFVSGLGVAQAVLPPLRRPRFEFLRDLGFSGTDKQLLEKAYQSDPTLLFNAYSASNMWTANAATVSPASDTLDAKLHLTPANLSSTLHRSIEHPSTERNLRAIFSDSARFSVHAPLPSQMPFSDEGAANHTRLGTSHGNRGLELFVFGVDSNDGIRPKKFPARQTRLASQTVARKHGLDSDYVVMLQQNPAAIDAGVFHNDVISVGNEDLLLCHELSFVNQPRALDSLKKQFSKLFEAELNVIEFSSGELSIDDAVQSYLFNSQLLTRPDGKMTLVCPTDCEKNPAAKRCTQRILAEDNRVDQVEFLDLRQSMNNGGGPACLRLRVVMSEEESNAVHQGVIFDSELDRRLTAWVEKHYREELLPGDLRDPQLVDEVYVGLEALATILGLSADVLLDATN